MSFTQKDTSSYTYFCFWAWHSLATAYFVLLLLSLLPLFGQNYQNKKVLPIFRSLVSSWYLQIFWQICQYCKYSKIGTQNISLYFVKKYIYWPCAMYMCIYMDATFCFLESFWLFLVAKQLKKHCCLSVMSHFLRWQYSIK